MDPEATADTTAQAVVTTSSVCLDRRARHRRLRAILFATDSLALLTATLGATYLRFETLEAEVAFERVFQDLSYPAVSVMVTGLWLVFLAFEGLYDLDRLFWGSGEFSRIVRSLSFGVVGFILLTFILKLPGLSRLWTVTAWGLAVTLVWSGRFAVRIGLEAVRRRGHLLRSTLVVGSNAEAEDIVRVLKGNKGAGFVPAGCLASSQADRLSLNFCPDDVPCLGFARELVDVVQAHNIDTVVIATSAFDHEVVSRMIAELRGLPIGIHLSSGLFEVLTSRVLVREVCGVPLITVRAVSLSRSKLVVKRGFDLAIASSIVVAGLPLWLLVTLAIKLESRGPIFYKQARVGRHGEAFGMFKFRSMVDEADTRLEELLRDNEADGPLFKMRNDPRVTRVGKWMRRYSIDEFPQLLNVIRGEMSLVGPRPPLISEADQYNDYHWRRMEVLPGMTGLWQVSGRSDLKFDEMVRLDLFYIENWSVRLDLALLVRTIPAVLFAQGAY
ncbi:MAG: sugar transferase [Coriobacteriia bacterium]|nr:sugar transferase [Coriobacteriia bacterium]